MRIAVTLGARAVRLRLTRAPHPRTAHARGTRSVFGQVPGAVISPHMPTLSDSDVDQRLQALGEWRRSDEQSIERDLKFDDFAAATAFVNRVAELAEQANHHPDILIHGWNKVRLTLSTHSQGGLTEADFALAERIEGLL
jgi:4a-hydroxytetrahydrobiopterin dehydratase